MAFRSFMVTSAPFVFTIILLGSCSAPQNEEQNSTDSMATDVTGAVTKLAPAVTTQPVGHDSDDPAIWIHPTDPAQSLIIGTDKGDDTGVGGLFVFNLQGEILPDKTRTLQRPNNVDIAYGLKLGDRTVDIAVAAERNTNSLRVFSLPDMTPVDGGGIPVFEGEELRAPMGIALYTNPETKEISAIVGRKEGPTDSTYLWQYRLTGNAEGMVTSTVVRKFGAWSGKKEIEAIAVDNRLGYVYYSDEVFGVRKYYAHPDSSNTELALFATEGITRDHEGISIYKLADGTGYILLSDQQANQFHIYPREGTEGSPHDHPLLKVVDVSTQESDGSDVTSLPLNSTFGKGLFVAMSDNATFQLYKWEDLAGKDLKVANVRVAPEEHN